MQAHAVSAAAAGRAAGSAAPRPCQLLVHCHAAQAAHAASSSSGSTSRRRLVERPRQQPTRCRAAPQPSGGAGQLLASIRRGQGLEGVLGGFSRQQPPASCKAEEGDDPPPNAPVTPDAFVEALDTLSKSASGSEVNPAQLDEILSEVVERRLLGSFSDAQLVASAKALAVICASVAAEFTTALVTQLGQRLGSLHTAQLSNVGWALLRLVPVTHAEARGLLGMTQAWLDAYAAACEAQLQQVLQLKQQPQPQQQQQQPQQCHQPLPSAQQLANLLLIPAAVQHAPAPELVSLLEQAVVARQHSLCGFAVAQLLTTYVRLELQPGPDLWAALLEHLTEELLLYDYDELAQVAFSAYVVQLELPDSLLADITRRAEALQEAGAAAPDDVAILRGSLERLAAQRAAGLAAAGTGR